MCVGLTDSLQSQSIEALSKSRVTGQGSKLRTYAKLKGSVNMESYLADNRLTWKQKRTLARIEKGRHCRQGCHPSNASAKYMYVILRVLRIRYISLWIAQNTSI